MHDDIRDIQGTRVLVCATEGPRLAAEGDATDFIGATYGQDVEMIALPLSRLSDDFLDLRTGLAGAVIQKFVNYRLRLAILGDIDEAVARSRALRDFVYEAKRGHACWFVRNLGELEMKLKPA